MDFCAEAKEEAIINIACDLKKCKGGKISSIPYANYGATFGKCPNYWATFKCVKEVNPFVMVECKDSPDCSFTVEADEFEKFKWTTNWG
jgi:hypothetical protein